MLLLPFYAYLSHVLSIFLDSLLVYVYKYSWHFNVDFAPYYAHTPQSTCTPYFSNIDANNCEMDNAALRNIWSDPWLAFCWGEGNREATGSVSENPGCGAFVIRFRWAGEIR